MQYTCIKCGASRGVSADFSYILRLAMVEDMGSQATRLLQAK